MTDKIVNEICNTFFHTLPTKIIRNNVGLAGYVYTVQICDDKYVIKISDDKNIISGATYWLDKIKHLDIPTPKVIAENTSTSPHVSRCVGPMDRVPSCSVWLPSIGTNLRGR